MPLNVIRKRKYDLNSVKLYLSQFLLIEVWKYNGKEVGRVAALQANRNYLYGKYQKIIYFFR